jgi:predicted MFS family arabinose efflux permease
MTEIESIINILLFGGFISACIALVALLGICVYEDTEGVRYTSLFTLLILLFAFTLALTSQINLNKTKEENDNNYQRVAEPCECR